MKTKTAILCAVLAIAAANPANAAWEFKTLEDPMTDAKRGISMLMGDQGALVVKCDKNGPGSLYLSIVSKDYLGGVSGSNTRLIKYRIDKGDPQQINAFYDKNMASVFSLRPSTSGGAFLQKIIDSKQLVIEAISYDYESHVIVFDTTGAKDAVVKAAATCGDTDWAP